MDERRDRDEHRHSDCSRNYHYRGSANYFRDERGESGCRGGYERGNHFHDERNESRQREWQYGRADDLKSDVWRLVVAHYRGRQYGWLQGDELDTLTRRVVAKVLRDVPRNILHSSRLHSPVKDIASREAFLAQHPKHTERTAPVAASNETSVKIVGASLNLDVASVIGGHLQVSNHNAITQEVTALIRGQRISPESLQQGKRGGSGGVSDIKIQTRIPKMLNLVRTTAEHGDPQAFPDGQTDRRSNTSRT